MQGVRRKGLAMTGRAATRLLSLAFGVALLSSAAWPAAVCRTTLPLDGRNVRSAESTLGDLLADAARAGVNADLALVQASQLRPDVIPAGDVSEESLRAVLVYPDETVVLAEITGSQLLRAVERGLSADRTASGALQPSTAFLQVSNLTVSFDSTRPPGQRAASVKVGAKLLVAGDTYRVALPASLAKGAMGYFRIFNGLKVKQTGPALGNCLISYARAARVLSLSPSQRLVGVSQPAPAH